MYTLPAGAGAAEPAEEWAAIFETASQLILNKADRASLLVFIGDGTARTDGFRSPPPWPPC